MDSPVNSFLRYVLGFLLFISISFGVTFGVNAIATKQNAAAQQASALQALLKAGEGAR
ncbi:MAG: hypothetical protein RIQ56_718 [Candidatus Parcubacteria bacterium]|jgi:hypothetical protein